MAQRGQDDIMGMEKIGGGGGAPRDAPQPLVAVARASIDSIEHGQIDSGEAVAAIETLIRDLQALAASLRAGDTAAALEPPEGAAAAAYRHRRVRERIFHEPRLFGEPAWDILLDLMIAEEQGKRLSVTAACIGAQVPATTALRQIVILEELGLVARSPDEADQRRAWVSLSAEGRARMEAYFAATG